MVERQYDELRELIDRARPGLGPVAAMAETIAGVLKSGHKVLTAGNGGSAADALHMAEELTGRYRANRRALPAIALAADGTALTCIGNDFGFEQVFSRQVEALGRPGDVLVVFTTSGNSPNIVAAHASARALGLRTLALLGRDGGILKGRSDIEWVVPHSQSARIQELHGWALHAILEVVEAEFAG